MPSADRRHGPAIALVCACLCALQIYAFHWGVITPDTVVQYGQALTGRYDDWHPPVTAWIWRQLGRIGSGSAPFLILDALLYWIGVAIVAAVLGRRGGRMAAATMPVLAALPIGFGQIGAILKDPLLACLLLMASALILWRERSAGRARRISAVLALPLIILASATRFNALFAAVPLLIMLMPPTAIRSFPRLIGCAVAAAALLAATGWLINVAALQPHRSQPIYSLINFDLAGIGAHGGGNAYPSLSDAEAARLTAHCYDPKLYGAHDGDGCAAPEDSLVDYAKRQHAGAIGIWLKAVSHAPLPYIEHRLAHLNWNWRFLLATIPDDAFYMMSQPNDLGLRFTANAVTKAIARAARIMAWSPLGRPITWLCIAIGLLIIAPRLPSRRFVTAMAVSALLYGGAYAAVSVASDLRYNLWTMLAVMIGLAVAIADARQAKLSIGKARRYGAFAPAMIVMLLETVALAMG